MPIYTTSYITSYILLIFNRLDVNTTNLPYSIKLKDTMFYFLEWVKIT